VLVSSVTDCDRLSAFGGRGSRPPTLSVWASRHLLKFIDFSDNTVSYHE
jgi:hypothetical protein